MGFKKELYIYLVFLLFTAGCGKANNQNDAIVVQAAARSLEGESLGAPDKETKELSLLEEEISQYLVVDEDSSIENDGMMDMSDEELERVYRDQWEKLSMAVDTFALTGVIEQQPAIINGVKKTKRGGGMSGLACLGLGIQGEAGGEGFEGMIAVGRTLLRRAGGSMARVCSALFARGQFESMQKRNRQVSASSLRAANRAVSLGSWAYDHFINKVLQRKMGRKIPKWVVNFEKRGCLIKNVGKHTFYASRSCMR